MIPNTWDDVKNGLEPQTLNYIQRVLQKGVQVEWMEFEVYMSFMIYCEGVCSA